MDGKSDRLVALDGWRAISALIVVVAHLQHDSSLAGVLARLPALDGVIGVQLFFGISGFVIGRSLLAERAATGQISLAGFYVRRLFRIVPPLILFVAVVELLAQAGLLDSAAKSTVNALTFTCNLISPACGGYVGGHTWSLSVEEQFYLIIPLVLAIVSIRSRAALTAVLLAFPFFVLGLYLANEVVLADVLSQFMTIGLGVACALHEDRARKIATALPGWTIIAALAAIFLLRGLEPTGTRSIMEVLLVPPLVMYVLLGSTFRRTILSAWLASRPVQTLGAASYSFYLWQQLATYPFPWAGGWFYAASLCACLLVAMASRRWLETPAIRVGTSLSRRIAHRQAAMVVATPP